MTFKSEDAEHTLKTGYSVEPAGNGGFVGHDLEPDGDGFAKGPHGHATRYHAILVRSMRPVPPPPKTLEDSKKSRDQ